MIQLNCYKNDEHVVLTFPVIMIQSHKGRFPDKTDEEIAELAASLAIKARVRISRIMSRSLLLAAPSVPRATLMPASMSF